MDKPKTADTIFTRRAKQFTSNESKTMTETHRPEIKIGSWVRIVDKSSAYKGYVGEVSEIFHDGEIAVVSIKTQTGNGEVSFAVRTRDLIQAI